MHAACTTIGDASPLLVWIWALASCWSCIDDLDALQLPAIDWEERQPSDDVHQQEHASPLINCNDVNASIALLIVHLLGMEVKD